MQQTIVIGESYPDIGYQLNLLKVYEENDQLVVILEELSPPGNIRFHTVEALELTVNVNLQQSVEPLPIKFLIKTDNKLTYSGTIDINGKMSSKKLEANLNLSTYDHGILLHDQKLKAECVPYKCDQAKIFKQSAIELRKKLEARKLPNRVFACLSYYCCLFPCLANTSLKKSEYLESDTVKLMSRD